MTTPAGSDTNPEHPDERARFMEEALKEAKLAFAAGEIPVGCVIVQGGQIIGRGHNEKETRKDPSAHAEVLAIRDACAKIGGWRLDGAILYVTLEPCPMCASLITQSRIREVHVALHEVQSGALGTVMDLTHDPLNHIRLKVYWDYHMGAQELLERFFNERKKTIRKDKGHGDQNI